MFVTQQQSGGSGIHGPDEWEKLMGNVAKLGEDGGSTHGVVCATPLRLFRETSS